MRELKLLSFGADVKELQTNLEKLGYGSSIKNGFFWLLTRDRVRKYQSDNKLPTTGIFGALERSVMATSLATLSKKKLYDVMLSHVGTDVTPTDNVPDDVACMETIDTLYFLANGCYINGSKTSITVSTYRGYMIMEYSSKFVKTTTPTVGTIIVYATGTGNGRLANGHIFICGKNGRLYSNSSPTGKLEQNYTLESAKARYETEGGFAPHFYDVV